MGLSKTAIKNLKFDDKGVSRQILFDSQVPGFGVRVYKSGRKSYVLQYGPTNARRLMVLAPCTTGAELDAVREQAQSIRSQYKRKGLDPLGEKQRQDASSVGGAVRV